jgi:hypothetical protein
MRGFLYGSPMSANLWKRRRSAGVDSAERIAHNLRQGSFGYEQKCRLGNHLRDYPGVLQRVWVARQEAQLSFQPRFHLALANGVERLLRTSRGCEMPLSDGTPSRLFVADAGPLR